MPLAEFPVDGAQDGAKATGGRSDDLRQFGHACGKAERRGRLRGTGGDQTERFVRDGIREMEQSDKPVQDRDVRQVKSMQPGDRIAIKSTYVRKNGINFDNNRESGLGEAIKAIVLLLLPFAAAPAVAQDMLFPGGSSYTYDFTEGNITDYEMIVGHDGRLVDPGEVLLSVTPVQGTGFVIAPQSDVTTTEFLAVFPAATDLVTANIKKSGGGSPQDRRHGRFSPSPNSLFRFDASAQFDGPPSDRHSQLWTKSVDVYEGNAAPAALGFKWVVVANGMKAWVEDGGPRRQHPDSNSMRGAERITQGALSAPAQDNGGLFEFPVPPSGTTSGDARVQFKSAPDFENSPDDLSASNVYHVRVYNTHDLHKISGEGSADRMQRLGAGPGGDGEGCRSASTSGVRLRLNKNGNMLELSWLAPDKRRQRYVKFTNLEPAGPWPDYQLRLPVPHPRHHDLDGGEHDEQVGLRHLLWKRCTSYGFARRTPRAAANGPMWWRPTSRRRGRR